MCSFHIVVQNYEQALRWLDPSCDGSIELSDEFVLAQVAAKVRRIRNQVSSATRAQHLTNSPSPLFTRKHLRPCPYH